MKSFESYRKELGNVLGNEIIPFWLARSIDDEFGGYITSFDDKGQYDGNGVKNIVTQSRMVWGFSNLLPFGRKEDQPKMIAAAREGAHFLVDKFWDKEYGGFYWLLNRDGSVKDPAKLTYGEGFAIYALAEYYLMSGDDWALDYACKGFDYLQKYAADTRFGGYYENIDRDWKVSPSGAYAGERKSLDIHMHLLEAFTTLYKASKQEIHGRKLREVYDIILNHMVNCEKGYGYNQFDLQFNKIPAISILRTWNAERESNEKIAIPTDTTSYGHNVELSWLGDLALKTLGKRDESDDALFKKLLDHALAHGYDYEFGGIYRDGIADGKVLVTDKEWWQNFESMTGFLNGYVLFHDEKYLDAFDRTWTFVSTYFMNDEIGESRQLLDRQGKPLVANLGNPWKGIYHTGRAFAECIRRLDSLIKC
jgi:mannobiose 2-epimerase